MRGQCPVCGKDVAIRKDGKPHAHGYGKIKEDGKIVGWQPRCSASWINRLTVREADEIAGIAEKHVKEQGWC